MLIAMQAYNQNFTSSPIRKINLKDFRGRDFEAVLSRLNPNDSEDRDAIRLIQSRWSMDKPFRFICANFLNKKTGSEFYAIELKKGTTLGHKLLGIVQIAGNIVEYLKSNSESGVKGVGENLLAKAFSLIKENGFKEAQISSVKDKFYYHIFEQAGMIRDKSKDIFACIWAKLLGHKISSEGTDYLVSPKKSKLADTDFFIYNSGIDKFIAYIRKKWDI